MGGAIILLQSFAKILNAYLMFTTQLLSVLHIVHDIYYELYQI